MKIYDISRTLSPSISCLARRSEVRARWAQIVKTEVADFVEEFWRIGSAYCKRPREQNKAAFREVVKRGPPPGLLAFDGDVAVSWCQLTPRDTLPWLDRAWRLKRVDDVPVWSLSCFYVRKGYRKRGLTSALIAAALKAAKRAKEPALEAYPLDADLTPSASGTGYASTFARAAAEPERYKRFLSEAKPSRCYFLLLGNLAGIVFSPYC